MVALTDHPASIAAHLQEPTGSRWRMSDAAAFSRNRENANDCRSGRWLIALSGSVAAGPDKTLACHSLGGRLNLDWSGHYFVEPIGDKRTHPKGSMACYSLARVAAPREVDLARLAEPGKIAERRDYIRAASRGFFLDFDVFQGLVGLVNGEDVHAIGEDLVVPSLQK